MNRANLLKLVRLRRQETRALLEAGHAAGAYYLAGYAVECALKARIAKTTRKHDFPDRDRVRDSHVHDLAQLLRLSELRTVLDAVPPGSALQRNWAIVKDWKETSRYDGTIDMKKARALYRAVTARRTGVLAWLRPHW